jgi:predicted RNA-binding Zn-ribbon protein involved in translation (DUF1610 family)
MINYLLLMGTPRREQPSRWPVGFLKEPEAKMLKEYILPASFHCPECGSGTAFAVIIDASHADAPIVCNECGFEYGNVGALRLALRRENSRSKSERETSRKSPGREQQNIQ